jgi:hypothetical protein
LDDTTAVASALYLTGIKHKRERDAILKVDGDCYYKEDSIETKTEKNEENEEKQSKSQAFINDSVIFQLQ